MLFIVCALPCEAAPFISHFQLKPYKTPSPFPIYTALSISLIISGVGKIQIAAAMGYLQGITNHLKHSAWINIGIAGHPSLPLGTGILAHQVFDMANGRRYYPIFVTDRPVQTAPVWTVEKPEEHYEEQVVYDMEASAFWSIASRFTTGELIHCYKVISDNSQSSFSCITPKNVEELIKLHIDPIETFIKALQNIMNSLQSDEITDIDIKPFLLHWHFTSTQQFNLRSLLQKWRACHLKIPELLFDSELMALTKSQQVLHYLEKKLHTLSFDITK
jgi:hypothetical protein